MDARRHRAKERRLDHSLLTAEPLIADGDHLAAGELISLLCVGAGGSCLHFLLIVKSHVSFSLMSRVKLRRSFQGADTFCLE